MRYAIVSDIHANITALTAVEMNLQRLRRRWGAEIEPWCLGDLVGYGPTKQAVRCVEWLRGQVAGEHWVAGNHDEWLVAPGSSVSLEAKTTLTAQRARLQRPENEDLWEWFQAEVKNRTASHPETGREIESLRFEHFPEHSLTLAFTHAAVSPLVRRATYLYPWLKSQLQAELEYLPGLWQEARENAAHQHSETLVLFCGHTHYPMLAHWNGELRLHSIRYNQPVKLGAGWWAINPGSVGQPRDGDPRAAFALWDTQEQTVEFCRIDYDTDSVSAELEQDPLAPAAGGAFERLANRIRTADGGADLALYRNIYRRPAWDLESLPDTTDHTIEGDRNLPDFQS